MNTTRGHLQKQEHRQNEYETTQPEQPRSAAKALVTVKKAEEEVIQNKDRHTWQPLHSAISKTERQITARTASIITLIHNHRKGKRLHAILSHLQDVLMEKRGGRERN